MAGIPCLEAVGSLTRRLSPVDIRQCVKEMWHRSVSVIVALLITGKATSKFYKSFSKSANEGFHHIIPNSAAESYHGNNVEFPLPKPFKPHLKGSRKRCALQGRKAYLKYIFSLYLGTLCVVSLVCSQQKLEIDEAFPGDSKVLFLTSYILRPSVLLCEQLRFTC